MSKHSLNYVDLYETPKSENTQIVVASVFGAALAVTALYFVTFFLFSL